MYSVEVVSKALGLKKPRMVSELVQKHFGKDSMIFESSGAGGQIKKEYFLTYDQLVFVLSRSRGDVDGCASKLGIDINSVCLMRNEQLFSSIIIEMIKITDLKFERQYPVNLKSRMVIVDLIVYGDFGCVVIEYDEKQHKYNKSVDTIRDNQVKVALKEKLGVDRVEVIRVVDSSKNFTLEIGRIHRMIHEDFFQPVCYQFD